MANKVRRRAYPTDLSDKQWEEIESLYTNMRTYKWDKRELTNGLCQKGVDKEEKVR